MSLNYDPSAEWLEADGLGGFASGTVSGIRTRRYHALVLTASNPPTGRFVLVNGCDAWVETPAGRFAISSQKYAPNVIEPDGHRRLVGFQSEPWPRWTFQLEDGTRIEQELFVPQGMSAAVLRWRLTEHREGIRLFVRPLFSGRDYHGTHHENPVFAFAPEVHEGRYIWEPYPEIPATTVSTNGAYSQEPVWYRNFLYVEEQVRGLDCLEDLASPGTFSWDLSREPAVWILESTRTEKSEVTSSATVERRYEKLRAQELARRSHFGTPLLRAADAYLVQGNRGPTIIAGYPWFTDWGRDTFISLRGLCLATGRLDEAEQILLSWAETVSEGMLPNRFSDYGAEPEYNAVDASLWYVVAVHEFLQAAQKNKRSVSAATRKRLELAVSEIISGYARGTRFGIRLDSDGLLAAGELGVQLTWMDARVGGHVVTPRMGKPVEIQALWINALEIAQLFSGRWKETLVKARQSFAARFWNASRSCLYDVVDVDHQPGTTDGSLRPNQILAVGGLPWALLEGKLARQVVDTVEASLWTPRGLRTLSPDSPEYHPHCVGGVAERDGAYHQGTVWPWLLGPFVEAWLRVRPRTPETLQQARTCFIEPLLTHLNVAGLGHVSEIVDGDPPHTPRGCPFQAWSVGELLRLLHTFRNADVNF